MRNNIIFYLGLYLALISIIAAGLTVYDKSAAKSGSPRVRERTLLLVAVLGGSAAMFITMRIIRHKTRRMKFMLGIPIIIIIQAAAIVISAKGGIILKYFIK